MTAPSSPSIEEIEQYLRSKILPDLARGRLSWDQPHTIMVVQKLKEILKRSPDFPVDQTVLLIAAYAHDWGYMNLFKEGRKASYDEIKEVKPLHMQIGAEKTAQLLEEPFFAFLTQRRKERIVHLISVHDQLEALKDPDELILMEADTLGALDTRFERSTFTEEIHRRYIQTVKERRFPRFITEYGKKEAQRLLEKG